VAISNQSIEYFFAEVTDFDEYTFKYPDDFGKIRLKTPYDIEFKTNGTQPFKDFASPANNSIKQIPLIGEHVIIFKTITKETSNNRSRFKWNYLPALPVQDIGVNNNKLNINTVSDNESEKTIKILQPYAGDLLIEGRYGNRIRLGRSIDKTNSNAKPTIWKTGNGKENDPIIILSVDNDAGKPELYVEEIKSMASSLHLTSTQDLSNSYQLSKELSKSNSSNGSQFIGSADKMILQSKVGPVIIDAKKRLSINTNEMLIGSENASSPIPKGDILEQILTQIITAINAGVIGPAGIYSTPTPGQGSLASAQSLLRQLNSKKFYIDKE
jgi:hypothetical protein